MKTLTTTAAATISADEIETNACCEYLDRMVGFKALTFCCCFWLLAVDNTNLDRLLETLLESKHEIEACAGGM